MKKILPFIFPLTSLAIVIFLGLRWYNDRTNRGSITPFAEDVEIKQLTDTETSEVLNGIGDYSTVDMVGADDQAGEIRYELEDGKVKFSVSADLEVPEGGFYQVWLKDTDSEAIRKAFVLKMMKGGLSGTAAISSETLPFEVLVSKESESTIFPSEVILKGSIESSEECDEEECTVDIEELLN